jgi:predicted ester cyclase
MPEEVLVVSRFIAAINQGDYQAIDELVAPSMVNWGSRWNGEAPADRGPQSSRKAIRAMRDGFPDLHVEIVEAILGDSRVTCRLILSGTHDGPYMGCEATGRQARWPAVFIYRIAYEHIAEMWSVTDRLDLLRQLQP